DITVSWLKDGKVLDVDSQFTSVWDVNSYNITVSPLSLRNLNSSESGDYSCRLNYERTGASEVVSSTVRLNVKSNEIRILSKPSLVKKSSLLVGCNYTTARGILLPEENTYWLFNQTVKLSATGTGYPVPNTDPTIFSTPSLIVDDDKWIGVFSCVIEIGSENVVSPLIVIQDEAKDPDPFFSSKPSITYPSASNPSLTASNCQFRYEGQPAFTYTYILYNADNTIIKETPATIRELGNDNFIFDSLVVTSYQDAASYYQCRISAESLVDPIVSLVSDFIDVKLPEFTSNPTSSGGRQFYVGDLIFISGCEVQSMFTQPLSFFVLYDPLSASNLQPIQQMITSNSFNETTGLFTFTFNEYVIASGKMSNTGFYACQVSFVTAQSPESLTIRSESIDIIISSNNVVFASNPTLVIRPDSVSIAGCSYTADRPGNLTKYSRWLYNGLVSNSLDTGNLSGKFKDIDITSYVSWGNYMCQVKIGTEIFNSSTLTVDEFPDPTITIQPTAKYNDSIGSPINITGCRISSILQMQSNNLYWLVNSIEKRTAFLSFDKNNAQFASLAMASSTINDQGFYQCAFLKPGKAKKLVLSNSANVQFKDISSTTVELSMNKQFIPAYTEPSSDEYQKLAKEVKAAVSEGLGNSQQGRRPIVAIRGFKEGSVIALVQLFFANVTQVDRKSFCSSGDSLISNLQGITTLGINNIKTITQDCCPADTVGEESFKGVYNYNVTLVNTDVRQTCVYSASSLSARQCIQNLELGPQWGEADLGQCSAKSDVTNQLIELTKELTCTTGNCTLNVVKVTENLREIVNNNTAITTRQDLEFIADIVGNTADSNTTSSETKLGAENIMKTVDVVVVSDKSIIAESEEKTQSSTKLVKNLEKLTSAIGKVVEETKEPFSVTGENTALIVNFEPPKALTLIARDLTSSDNQNEINIAIMNSTTSPPKKRPSLVRAEIPAEAFGNKSQAVSSLIFRENTLLQETNNTNPVISSVLSISVGDQPVSNLTTPLILRFQRTTPNETLDGTDLCSFWDFSAPTGEAGRFGRWSTDGCRLIANQTTATDVVCECDHMTNFAILFDVSQTQSNPLELQIITWIGCGISIAGLFITLVTYLYFYNLRTKLAPKILINLSISMLCLLILFISVVDRTTPRVGCQIIAGLIQYFMLSTFCWMAVEGANLYRMFVTIFSSGSTGKFYKKASIFGWGLPALIVIITGAVSPENMGNEQFCVTVGYPFYFAVLLPVCLILMFNFAIITLVMRSLVRTKANAVGQGKSIQQQAKIAFAASALLGLTWIFGVLAVGDLRDFFQYLFTIFNSLQGFFIFFFYTLRNPEAKKNWLITLGLRDEKLYSLTDSTAAYNRQRRTGAGTSTSTSVYVSSTSA
uniref:Uncharacterized protein n=2 Tax=Clytia hemisphaerica TaxID=252671 RepID=A0A7M5X0H9_9CNID